MGLRWNSALHPRDSRGRFRSKGGGSVAYQNRVPRTQGTGIRLTADEKAAIIGQSAYGALTYGGVGLTIGGLYGGAGGAAIGGTLGAADGVALVRKGRKNMTGAKVKR